MMTSLNIPASLDNTIYFCKSIINKKLAIFFRKTSLSMMLKLIPNIIIYGLAVARRHRKPSINADLPA